MRAGFVPQANEIRNVLQNPYLSDNEAMAKHMQGDVTVAQIIQDRRHQESLDRLIRENEELKRRALYLPIYSRPLSDEREKLKKEAVEEYKAQQKQIKKEVKKELKSQKKDNKKPKPKKKLNTK